jgi:hypothetical protein
VGVTKFLSCCQMYKCTTVVDCTVLEALINLSPGGFPQTGVFPS